MTPCPAGGAAAAPAALVAAAGRIRATVRPTPETDRRRPPLSPAPTVHENKFISVLFADLCGSTETVSSFDPEEAQQYLVSALTWMSDVVAAYGGTVSQLLGDGLLALFGAPVSHEDHALRACLTAVELLRRAADNRPPLRLRIGISSGHVIVGTHGESFARQYRADGTTMHLAARLEQLAAPGATLISGATMRLAGEQIETVSLGTQSIRGLKGEVEVYRLVTGSHRSAAAPLARRRQMSTMVGRSATFDWMHAVARVASAGSMRALGLRGDPGIGKSRLIVEFRKQIGDCFDVHCVAAHAYTAQVSYGVVTELVRNLIGVPLDLDLEPQRDAARAIVAGWPDAERLHRAAIADLLDLGDVDADWAALMPASRRRHIADLVFWLITRRLASPMMIVVEDIFLADRDSERLIESLARRLENMPVLFCFTYRQDFNRRWLDASWMVEHLVGPLSVDDMTRLAYDIVGRDDSTGSLVALLVERANGNPFFLEQLAITLIDNGTLVGAPRAYVCRTPVGDLSVPGSVSAVIAARIDRLPPATKASVEAAAILSERATSALIASMRGVPVADADNQLMLAVSLGLLSAPSVSDQPRYRFRHALVQEVVAATLTRPRRKALHQAAFAALKAQQGDLSIDRSALLVQHAYHGEDWASAAQLALASMKRSIGRSANRDALRVFELGIDAVKRLPPGVAALELELSLCAESLGALLPLGKIDACIANLVRAEAVAVELHDVRRQAAVALQLALTQWTKGSYTLALAAAGKAEAAADAAGSRSVKMASRHARMTIHHGLGRYASVATEARAIMEDFAEELAKLELIHGWAVIAAINIKAFLADAMWRMARLDEAQATCDQAYQELARHEHVFSRVLVDFVQGQIWIAKGRFGEAVELFAAALQACRANDNVTMVPVFVAALGGALARTGRTNEAIAMLEKGIAEKLYLTGGRYNDFYFPMNLAIALAEAGRYAEARESAEAALAAASAFAQHGHQAEALFQLAEIEVAAGRSDHALTLYQDAAALASECSMALLLNSATARVQQVNDSMRVLNGFQRRHGAAG